jgi:hypothetical protein
MAARLGHHVHVQFPPELHDLEHITVKESHDGIVQTACVDTEREG